MSVSIQKNIFATRGIFLLGGTASSTWAPLVPLLKQRLAVEEDTLGLLLLCIGIGSLLIMPFSGNLVARFGCRKVLCAASIPLTFLLFILCTMSSIFVSAAALLMFGACIGCLDVTANIHSVLVEKKAKRSLMSGLHAFWSIGGFVGAGLFGVWVGFFNFTPLTATMLNMMVLVALLIFSYHGLLTDKGEKSSNHSLLPIPRGVVIYVCIIAFITFLVEGAMMDWSGLLLTTVKHMDISMAGVGFAFFSACMFLMRMFGSFIIHTFGEKKVTIVGSLITVFGFAWLLLAPSPIFFLGFVLIAVGVANIIPIFFSMLGKQKSMPINVAVSAVSTTGYAGILLGPALMGMIAARFNLFDSFVMLAVLVLIQIGFIYKAQKYLR